MNRLKNRWIWLLWVLPALACTMSRSPEDSAIITPLSNDSLTAQPQGVVITATLPLPNAPTKIPTPTLAVPPTQQAVPVLPSSFRVVFVPEDDLLNVRWAAGVGNEVLATLSPNEGNIFAGGATQYVGNEPWMSIEKGGVLGWVNSRYLTEAIAPNDFCADPAARSVLDDFVQQVSNSAGKTGLTTSVNPERGLRVHTSWWNPEVHLFVLNNMFNSNVAYEWGTDPTGGSGLPVVGSVGEVLMPMLEEDLVGATQIGCNEILHGSTAGFVQLPASYEGVNYYSIYRPATGDIEFDWGTWVVGIERWQGQYFVSFLVHFQWEI